LLVRRVAKSPVPLGISTKRYGAPLPQRKKLFHPGLHPTFPLEWRSTAVGNAMRAALTNPSSRTKHCQAVWAKPLDNGSLAATCTGRRSGAGPFALTKRRRGQQYSARYCIVKRKQCQANFLGVWHVDVPLFSLFSSEVAPQDAMKPFLRLHINAGSCASKVLLIARASDRAIYSRETLYRGLTLSGCTDGVTRPPEAKTG
jgi:hypothetical protein